MQRHQLNQREIRILKWSPLLLAISLLCLFSSLWNASFNTRFLLMCVVTGLLFGGSAMFSFWKDPTRLWLLWYCAILMGVPMLFGNLLFSSWPWKSFLQFASMIFVCTFSIAWLVRGPLLRAAASIHDVEVVAGERGIAPFSTRFVGRG